ncbi:diguanylate cyclase [Clostridiaceae bacterium 35-E11]
MKEADHSKINLYYKRYFIALIAIWIGSLLILSYFSYYKAAKDIRDQLGSKAILLAKDISQRFILKEKDVKRLLELDINQLLKDPINIDFEKDVRAVIQDADIKYVYIEALLQDEEVKYIVEEGEKKQYDAEPGTPLQIIYLLDAVVSDGIRLKDTKGGGYVDKDRYTIMNKQFLTTYRSKTPSYYMMQDRWGSYITGYAPFYDGNGNYIGLLGVDIFIEKYNKELKEYLIWIGGFVFINLIIGTVAVYLGFRVKSAEQQAKEKEVLSCLDELTSISNRRKFREIFEKEWQRAIENKQEISLLLIDLDYFKEFNDNYGHLKGDALLRKVALLLQNEAEQHKGFVSRYGGDEFIILLPNMDMKESQKVSDAIIKALEKCEIPHEYSPISQYQTMSIGLASIIPTKDTVPEVLFSYADSALYQAKRYGRNQVCIGEMQ